MEDFLRVVVRVLFESPVFAGGLAIALLCGVAAAYAGLLDWSPYIAIVAFVSYFCAYFGYGWMRRDKRARRRFY